MEVCNYSTSLRFLRSTVAFANGRGRACVGGPAHMRRDVKLSGLDDGSFVAERDSFG